MNVELGHLRDGRLVLMSDQDFPADVKRVEYYRDQRLFMLVYERAGDDGDLMEYEISDFAADLVKKAPAQILVVSARNPADLKGFDVPLIQVGV